MRTIYHQPIGTPRPKRGDLIHSNVGDKRERTLLAIGTRVMPNRWCSDMAITAQRTMLWMERWWQIEPETRMALYRSAERHGGQRLHTFKRFPAKRKPTFEQHMRKQIKEAAR
jgi:hypothetical protein